MPKLSTITFAVVVCPAVLLGPMQARGDDGKPNISVGINDGDLRGKDQRVIQAGIDYVANLGGGTVSVLPGRYELNNAIQMRTGIRLLGTPGKTVFVHGPGRKTALARDVAKGAREIALADATGLEVGMGVFLQDKSGHGFQVTTATLTQRIKKNVFRIFPPTEQEYLLNRKAEVKLGYSGIHCRDIRNAKIDGITVVGNYGRPGSQYLGGCRGGGIYLAQCSNVVVRRCTVRKFNGDAISFQKKCRQIIIERCTVEKNANVGIHPGSYSHSCVVRDNIIRNNGYVGLFVCVGVRKVLFEKNAIEKNSGCGISIGFDDSDNVFRGNQVIENAETGILFRRDSNDPKHGAHANVFEKNIIRDNLGPRPARSNSRPESAGKASVVIEGTHHGLVFRNNEFSFTKKHTGCAVLYDAASKKLTLSNNRLINVAIRESIVKTKDKKPQPKEQ